MMNGNPNNSSVCVCQNTYTNAEKLLEAADQLAQSGECEEEEIYQAARDLEIRMQVTLTEFLTQIVVPGLSSKIHIPSDGRTPITYFNSSVSIQEKKTCINTKSISISKVHTLRIYYIPVLYLSLSQQMFRMDLI